MLHVRCTFPRTDQYTIRRYRMLGCHYDVAFISENLIYIDAHGRVVANQPRSIADLPPIAEPVNNLELAKEVLKT